MALDLCPWLAHFCVLKLGSELHGGGTGRVETSETSYVVCFYWIDLDLATRQPVTIQEFRSPSHFRPHLKRKALYTFVWWWIKYSRTHKTKNFTNFFWMTRARVFWMLLNSTCVLDCSIHCRYWNCIIFSKGLDKMIGYLKYYNSYLFVNS